jgi:hypothetical protein
VVWNGSAIFSGLSNGLEIMLDAEVYDNADPEANSDGFHILVTDPEVQNLKKFLKLFFKMKIRKTITRVIPEKEKYSFPGKWRNVSLFGFRVV